MRQSLAGRRTLAVFVHEPTTAPHVDGNRPDVGGRGDRRPSSLKAFVSAASETLKEERDDEGEKHERLDEREAEDHRGLNASRGAGVA